MRPRRQRQRSSLFFSHLSSLSSLSLSLSLALPREHPTRSRGQGKRKLCLVSVEALIESSGNSSLVPLKMERVSFSVLRYTRIQRFRRPDIFYIPRSTLFQIQTLRKTIDPKVSSVLEVLENWSSIQRESGSTN